MSAWAACRDELEKIAKRVKYRLAGHLQFQGLDVAIRDKKQLSALPQGVTG